MEQLTVTLIQADLVWQNPLANRQRIAELLAKNIVSSTDIIVLPEMFTTGFTMQPEPWAETMNGETVDWMSAIAQQYQAAVVGSIICQEGGRYFNRLLWVQADVAEVRHYDKRHLFTYAGEDKHYQAGTEQLFIDYQGWRIMPLICYDLRFPVWSRNVADYDLLLYVANFPDKRGDAWRTLLRARAIENQAYTIGLNRVGLDENGVYYAGDSCLVDYAGAVQVHLPPREMVHTFTLERAAQASYRSRFSFLQDRDTFQLGGC